MFNIDLGNSGGGGPFLAWSALGTRDGAVPALSFYIRDGASKEPFDTDKGIIMDIDSLKTGWQHSEGSVGVAPKWRWNASVNHMMERPGDEWKKGWSARFGIGGKRVATFEQAGSAAWQCLENLAPLLQRRPDATSLPLVRLKEAKAVQFSKGSTQVPILEIIEWRARPDSLKEGVAAGIAGTPTPPPPPPPAAAQISDAEF